MNLRPIARIVAKAADDRATAIVNLRSDDLSLDDFALIGAEMHRLIHALWRRGNNATSISVGVSFE